MRLTFEDKRQEADDIYSFTFGASEEVEWAAGQTIGLEIETEFLAEERHFTISSAPFEKHITITTEISDSDFKQALNRLKPGDGIDAFAIGGGNFVWENRPSIFIAGGMGITPYFSMLKQLAHEKRNVESIQLFYSTKKEKLLFKRELQQLAEQIGNVGVHFFINERISIEKIEAQVNNFKDRMVYIAGPSGMVDELGEELISKVNVDDNNIKRDWFTGL